MNVLTVMHTVSRYGAFVRHSLIQYSVCMQGMTINESYCGEAEQNGPLVGDIAVESSPILTFADTQLTSVAAAAVNGHTVIYLGTRHGHLKKVRPFVL